MALIPDPSWRHPGTSWESVLERYLHFRRVKAWRGRTHNSDGTATRNRLTLAEVNTIRRTLFPKIKELVGREILPGVAYPIAQSTINALLGDIVRGHRLFHKSPTWLQHLWRAIIFNRDCYTCAYCGRTPWGTHRELGATLRLELDHRRAKSKLGSQRDDFNVRNIITACRSCNVIKGQMDVSLFQKELLSLISAVFRNRKLSASNQ